MLGISAISVSSFGSNLNPLFVAFPKGGEDFYAFRKFVLTCRKRRDPANLISLICANHFPAGRIGWMRRDRTAGKEVFDCPR